jgi:hypothetical protein
VPDLVPQGSTLPSVAAVAAAGPPPAVDLELTRPTPRRVPAALLAALGGLVLMVTIASGPMGRTLLMLAVGAVMMGLIGFIVLLPRSIRVRVGHDGLWVAGVGQPRYIGFDRLLSASLDEKGVELSLAGGERIDLLIAPNDSAARSLGPPMPPPPPLEPPGAPLYRAIVAAQQRHRSAPAELAPPTALLAAARHEEGGLAPLRALAHASGYRGGLSADELWPLVENPRAAPSARAAAAIALAPSLDDDGRRLLRAHAAASALPPLRLALDAVAMADEQALLAAVEWLRHGD